MAQLAATGLQNAQAVPFVRGGLRGALVLLTPRAIHHDFGSGSYLVTVTGYVANALETQKLLDDLKRSADDYSALARFGQQIETITDIDELASHGLRELVSQLRVHYATLASVEDGFAVPRWRAGEAGPQAQRLLEQPIPLDRGVVAQAVATGEPVLVQDYRSYDQRPHYLRNLNFASVLALPFDTGSTGEFVFIFASTDQDQPIAETSVAIAALFAKRMANAFERVAQIAEVKATREETFRALGLALEYRDYETKGHTDRVVLYTERFGQLLGYDNASLVPLRWGAYLHDIGKLSIPDHILLKAGPLTDAEFSVIRQHPITGEELSREVSFLPDVTHHMVRHHHEKWDGSGYPDGLQGDEIPIEARLFALVDVYDALTSKRPYRPAWSEDRARTYMKEQSGKHFDPELLARFLDLIRHPPRAPGG